MELPTLAILALLGVTVALILTLVARPGIIVTRGGKMLAFLVLFLMPALCLGVGTSFQIDRSKQTKFCLSCHEMQPFGRSLLVDDPLHVPAKHFQNHRVPPDEACYTCHTNYAMFGGFKAKLRGMRHLYVHYLRTPPAPEVIRLYEPFNNRECLHCHEGARTFEEGAVHTADPDLLPAVKANKTSCVSSGCHETIHNVGTLDKEKFWKGGL